MRIRGPARRIAAHTAAAAAFTGQTAGVSIAALIDRTRCLDPRDRAGVLETLLPERHPVYSGRSTNETIRLRGYLLAAFEDAGLSNAAVPYVVEQLELGRDAYLVAAAAKAARGWPRPSPDWVPHLLKAVDNIALHDDAVTFECYEPRWPLPAPTTALIEIFRTFAWLGASARAAAPSLEALLQDCRRFHPSTRAEIERAIERIQHDTGPDGTACCGALAPGGLSAHARWRQRWRGAPGTSRIVFEDQNGELVPFADVCGGKPSIVVFFYTRCDNPNKCSLTIAQLARLQAAVRVSGLSGRIRTLAITYDPAYDLPPRLRCYGADRGVAFSGDDRFVRAVQGIAELNRFFMPGVNFGPLTVNQHRLDLFVLDRNGRITARYPRLQWSIERVVADAAAALHEPTSSARVRGGAARFGLSDPLWNGAVRVCATVALALVPKCPFCWSAYLTAAGLGTATLVAGSPTLRYFLLLVIVLDAIAISVRSISTGRIRLPALGLSTCGLAAVLAGFWWDAPPFLAVGALAVTAGALRAAPSR